MSSSPQITGAAHARQKRKQILVLPAMQMSTMVPLVVFAVLFAALSWALVLRPLGEIAEREPDPAVREIAADQTSMIHVRTWGILGLCVVIAGVVGIFRSHRIAGPLFRLERTLRLVGLGHTGDFRVRKGDWLTEFENSVRALREGMQSTVKRNREALLNIQSQVRGLHLRLGQGEVPQKEIRDVTYAILSQFERMPDLAPPPRKN
jgi:hypothetical protein